MLLRLSDRERESYLRCPQPLCDVQTKGQPGARCVVHGDHLVAPGLEAERPLLGRYRPVDVLARGGFATIQLAIDLQATQGDGLVVIKRLNAEHRMPNKVASKLRFRTEGELLGDFGGLAGVVGLIADEVAGQERFLVLEYIDGINLYQCVQRFHRLPPDRACRVTMSLLVVLSTIHRRNVIHRDIKPDNVMITELGAEPGEATRVCLLDFGIAKRTDDAGRRTAAITQQGLLLGTLSYMAPEQRVGKPADERSDIYSVGATLYHMLAGHAPFDGSPHEIASLPETASPLPLPSNLLLPNQIEAVLRRAMHVDPAQRYPSADAMLHALEEATGEPICKPVDAAPLPRAAPGVAVEEGEGGASTPDSKPARRTAAFAEGGSGEGMTVEPTIDDLPPSESPLRPASSTDESPSMWGAAGDVVESPSVTIPEGHTRGVVVAAAIAFTLATGVAMAWGGGRAAVVEVAESSSTPPVIPPPARLEAPPLAADHFVHYAVDVAPRAGGDVARLEPKPKPETKPKVKPKRSGKSGKSGEPKPQRKRPSKLPI